MLKRSHVEEKLGKYAEALRWTDSARELLLALPGAEAARQAAESSAWYAMVLQFEGRTTEALDWAQRAVDEAEAADDPDALGDAYFVMGWAYGELGREGAQPLMERSLEAFQRAGNLVRQAGVLSTLGVVCQWEGRWDEALSCYERGRDANLKIGSTVGAAVGAHQRRRDPDRSRRMGGGRSAVAGNAAACGRLRSIAITWLRACLFSDGCRCVWVASTKRSVVSRRRKRISCTSAPSRKFPPSTPALPDAVSPCGIGHSTRTGARHADRASASNGVATLVPLLERVQGHALMRQGISGARAMLWTRVSQRRGAQESVRGDPDHAFADRTRSPGGHRASVRDGHRESLAALEPEGPRRPTRSATSPVSFTNKAAPRGRSSLPVCERSLPALDPAVAAVHEPGGQPVGALPHHAHFRRRVVAVRVGERRCKVAE